MYLEKMYRVKILDFKYLSDHKQLNFKYFIYEIEADSEEEAIKLARSKYMLGIEPLFLEELPFLIKLFLALEQSWKFN